MSFLLYNTNFIKRVVTESNHIGFVNSFILQQSRDLTSVGKKYPVVHLKTHQKLIHNDPPKKLICISPGGFKGFYLTGVIAFIKNNYDISDYIFSGASAGSWNALILAYKGDVNTFINKILRTKTKITKSEKINDFELNLKKRILENFHESDFELNKIYIGVTTIHPNCYYIPLNNNFMHNNNNNNSYFIKTSIFHNFTCLEDVLDCCIASSHIPLITGGIINKYKNYYTFDGGFSRYPYYDLISPDLIITPNMWDINKKTGFKIEDYTTLLCKEKYDFVELYEKGYNDTQNNRALLDKIFLNKMT